MQYTRVLLIFIILLFRVPGALGQTFELGLAAGGSGYMGDLNQTDPLKISGISAGAYVKLNIDPYWAVGVHYTYGKIEANDAESKNSQFRDRNLNFKTALNELSLQVDFNFLHYFAGGGYKKFTPYIFTGIGGVFYNPIAVHHDREYTLRSFQTEGQSQPYRNYAFSIPYGVGVKLQIKNNLGMFSQIGYRTAHTDYMDDVSGRYPDPNVWVEDNYVAERKFLSDPSNSQYGAPGIQRGDFRKRDTYMFVGIGISYTFVSQKCYTF